MPTALLTGSAGFVGRHLHDALIERGYDVAPFDIKDGAQRDIRWQLANGDLGYYDLVVHCAAVVGGRAKIDGAPLEVAYDFGLDSDVIQFCARTRPGRVALFSSSAAYPIWLQGHHLDVFGAPERPALRETQISLDQIQQPDGVYGLCKLALEFQARELARLGLKVHVFRPFSGYGADQDDDYPWPAIMKRALAHWQGDLFPLWSPVNQTRDWVHIDDVVAQVMACIDQDVRGPINLCTGVATQFGDLAWLAVKAAAEIRSENPFAEIRQQPGMPSGVHYRVGDPTEINRVCPARINVALGIRRTMNELTRETRTFLAPSCDRDQLCTRGLNHRGLCTRPYSTFLDTGIVHDRSLD